MPRSRPFRHPHPDLRRCHRILTLSVMVAVVLSLVYRQREKMAHTRQRLLSQGGRYCDETINLGPT